MGSEAEIIAKSGSFPTLLRERIVPLWRGFIAAFDRLTDIDLVMAAERAAAMQRALSREGRPRHRGLPRMLSQAVGPRMPKGRLDA